MSESEYKKGLLGDLLVARSSLFGVETALRSLTCSPTPGTIVYGTFTFSIFSRHFIKKDFLRKYEILVTLWLFERLE